MVLDIQIRVYIENGKEPILRSRDPNDDEQERINDGKLTVIAIDADGDAFHYDPSEDYDEDYGQWKEIPNHHDN